ncbi:MAG: isochorismate synthase, partial [Solirubrobacteraceae bacterium]
MVGARTETLPRGPFALPDPSRDRLAELLRRAVRDARRHGETVAAVSWRLDATVDPSAVVLASRRSGEPWMCFEQPDRERSVVAALGAAVALEDRGHQRFERTAERWRDLVARAHVDTQPGPPGSGLVACGGFAFAGDGGGTHAWSGFAPASLVLGEVTLARWGVDVWCTLAVAAGPDDSADVLLEGIETRLGELSDRPLPLLDPHPT